MKPSYYNSIPERLRELFPDFVSDFEDEYIYPVLFELFIYVTEYRSDYEAMEVLVKFIKEAFDTNDSMTKEAVTLQILESAMEDERLKTHLSSHLSGSALEYFNKLKENLE